MPEKLDKTWHLAKDAAEVKVTEFEFQVWRCFYGFLRWQEDCQRYACGDSLTGNELSLLHIIRMNDQPKTIYELSRLLNRDDPNNIQYSIGKLIEKGLVAKEKITPKVLHYRITKEGIKNTDTFCKARSAILVELFKKFDMDRLDVEKITEGLSAIKGIYDEASHLAAAYKKK